MCSNKVYMYIGIALIVITMITSVMIPIKLLVPAYKRWLRVNYCNGCRRWFERSQYKNRLFTFKLLLGFTCLVLNAAFIYILDKLICYG